MHSELSNANEEIIQCKSAREVVEFGIKKAWDVDMDPSYIINCLNFAKLTIQVRSNYTSQEGWSSRLVSQTILRMMGGFCDFQMT